MFEAFRCIAKDARHEYQDNYFGAWRLFKHAHAQEMISCSGYPIHRHSTVSPSSPWHCRRLRAEHGMLIEARREAWHAN